MYDIILKTLVGRLNYSFQNITNIYNFIVATFELIPDEKKKIYVSNIKLMIGMTFCKNLKMYVYEKDPDNELLKFL